MTRERTKRSLTVLALFALLLAGIPTSLADQNERNASAPDDNPHDSESEIAHGLNGFRIEEIGRPYPIPESLLADGEKVYSLSNWINQDLDKSELFTEAPSATTSGRACTPYQVGDITSVRLGGVPAPDGTQTLTAEVKAVTANAAFIVETNTVISTADLNAFTSAWSNNIYPTISSIFAPLAGITDSDDNCQIEIFFYPMDGGGGTGGYQWDCNFNPATCGFDASEAREAIFVDSDDAGLAWARFVICHELQHLLHAMSDQGEAIWLNEGFADLAGYLTYNDDNAFIGHFNSWSGQANHSIRMWNARQSDYGAGAAFAMYLYGIYGSDGIRSIFQNTANSVTSIEQLAANQASNLIGYEINDIIANFTAAMVIDSADYDFPNAALGSTCAGTTYCKLQLTDQTASWASEYVSSNTQIEGWGVKAYKFIPPVSATGSTLSMQFEAGQDMFEARLVAHNTNTGNWDMTPIAFTNKIGPTSLNEFGTTYDQAYAIAWWASAGPNQPNDDKRCTDAQGDTQYPLSICPYGLTDLRIRASLISDPATVMFNANATHDADMDQEADTYVGQILAQTAAYYEKKILRVEALDSNDNVVDQFQEQIEIRSSNPVFQAVYFTPKVNGTYTIRARLYDLTGALTNEGLSSTELLRNMRPEAIGSSSLTAGTGSFVNTWASISFTAEAGHDYWGLRTDESTFTHDDAPANYEWDFGDGNTSQLRNPTYSWITPSISPYNVTLRVQDTGGAWSVPLPVLGTPFDITAQTSYWPVIPIDEIDPILVISTAGLTIDTQLEVLTQQKIIFNAEQTIDNVPIDNINFHWSWGDGNDTSSDTSACARPNCVIAVHSWSEGTADGQSHTLQVSADDGKNIGMKNITIRVLNRPPLAEKATDYTISTLSQLKMPDLFSDVDGQIVSTTWNFDDAQGCSSYANIQGDGLGVGLEDDFSSTTKTTTPGEVFWASWKCPGTKEISVNAIDDDGNVTIIDFSVYVENQAPVSVIERSEILPNELVTKNVEAGETVTFDASASFDPDSAKEPTYAWHFSDTNETILRTVASHTFLTPGRWTITLSASDDAGGVTNKSIILLIENPLPIAMMQVREVWVGGALANRSSPLIDASSIQLRQTFTESGEIIIGPGVLLRFMSDGTRDSDLAFAGMTVPLNQSDPLWNGITQYRWDFGDSSPPSEESSVWHAFDQPGTYTVTLTVRDGFGTGDTATVEKTIIVDSAPRIIKPLLDQSAIVVSTEIEIESATAADYEDDLGIIGWRDLDIEINSDGIGESDDDMQESLTGELQYFWDFDDRIDADKDGNYTNDADGTGSTVTASWTRTGYATITIRICDLMGQCISDNARIQVLSKADAEGNASEFDLKSLIPKAGNDGGMMLGLLALVLLLGWLVMRQRDEIEVDASASEGDYSAPTTGPQGGVLGMDQHVPPQVPKQLNKEQRTNQDSGYISPAGRGR